MFSNLSHLLHRSPKSARRPTRTSLELVKLEDRTTPALFGSVVHLNTITPLNQYDVASASNPAGTRVAVWTHDATAANQDIHAQRYTRLGAKIGPEIKVAGTAVDETQADVAIDSAGRFYVVYVKQSTTTNRDILVARYSAAGAFLGTTAVAVSALNEYDPHISVSPGTGSFAISYTLQSGPTDQDVIAKMYTSAGALVHAIPVANSPLIDEANSDIARVQSPAGDTSFGVVYTINNRDIYGKGYDAAGMFLGVRAVATTAAIETNPSISANSLGNYAVAWQAYVGGNWNVYALVINGGGGGASAPGLVLVSAANETDPTVAIKNDNDFVVGYQTKSSSGGYYVYATEMNFLGLLAPTRRAVLFIAGPTATTITRPSVAIDATGYYTIAYALLNGPGDPGHGVFGRLGLLV